MLRNITIEAGYAPLTFKCILATVASTFQESFLSPNSFSCFLPSWRFDLEMICFSELIRKNEARKNTGVFTSTSANSCRYQIPLIFRYSL